MNNYRDWFTADVHVDVEMYVLDLILADALEHDVPWSLQFADIPQFLGASVRSFVEELQHRPTTE